MKTNIVKASENYILPIKPMASPRPRFRVVTPKGKKPFVSTYMPPEYMSWKAEAAKMISDLNIAKEDWNFVFGFFFIPIPPSYRRNRKKAARMHGTLHQVKPDYDNYLKSLMDALHYQDEYKTLNMPIQDDSTLSSGLHHKIWIDDPIGKITFRLVKIELDPLMAMAI